MRRSALLFGSSLALLAGCSSNQGAPSASSESDHTEGEYVHAADSAFVWTEAVKHDALSYRDEDLSKVLPDADPLPSRIQAWADRIDEIVRTSVTAGGGELRAPKPIVKVLPSDKTFDAWVGTAPACLGLPFAGPAAEGDTQPTHVVLGASSMRALALPDTFACAQPSDWPKASELTSAWEALDPACDLSLSKGTLTSKTCETNAAPETLLIATTPYVHFSTPMLAFMDEKTMVTRLAHELGHYYRAHSSTMFEHRYGFWYESDPKLPGRPVPAEDQRKLDTLYRGVFEAPKNMVVKTAKYHGRMQKTVAFLAYLMKERTDADFVCADAAAKSGDWLLEFVKPDEKGLSRKAKSGYLAFEKELRACAPSLEIGDEPSADTFVKDQLVAAVDSGGFDPAVLGELTTLEAALASLGEASKAMDVAEKEMLAKLTEGKIGLYTTEQEADEIALEVVTKLGITPGEVVGGAIKNMALLEKLGAEFSADQTGELGSAACQALLDAGFTEKDEAGETVPVQMTLGSLDNPNHGECYRVYNLWRENNAHKYEAKVAFEPPAGAGWDELAYEAAKLSGLIEEADPPPPESQEPPQDVSPSGPSSEEPDPSSDDRPRERFGQNDPPAASSSESGCGVARTNQASATTGLLVAAALVAATRRRRRAAR